MRTVAVRGRLAQGVTAQQADADLKEIAARLERDHPDTNRGWSVHVQPLRELKIKDFRPRVALLFAAVALVLIAACANVANLLLARMAQRER